MPTGFEYLSVLDCTLFLALFFSLLFIYDDYKKGRLLSRNVLEM